MKAPPRNLEDYASGFFVTCLLAVPSSFTTGDLLFQPKGVFYAANDATFKPGSRSRPVTLSKALPPQHVALILG